jgi:hypothetical protein
MNPTIVANPGVGALFFVNLAFWALPWVIAGFSAIPLRRRGLAGWKLWLMVLGILAASFLILWILLSLITLMFFPAVDPLLL